MQKEVCHLLGECNFSSTGLKGFPFVSEDSIEDGPSAAEGCSMSNDEDLKADSKKLLDVTELLQGKIICQPSL